MFIDQRHKGLATYRAHREDKKGIAIIAKEVAESNPDKTPKECKDLATEIYEARKRTAETERKRESQKKKQHQQKSKRRREKRKPTKRTVEVTVVNPVK